MSRASASQQAGHLRMAAVAFAFFSFEAYLNERLQQVAPKVAERERHFFREAPFQGPMGKFQFLALIAGYEYVEINRPYATVNRLKEARDSVAHPKTLRIDEEIDVDSTDEIVAKAAYEAFLDPKVANDAITDVRKLTQDLQDALVARFGYERVGYSEEAFGGITGQGTKTLLEFGVGFTKRTR